MSDGDLLSKGIIAGISAVAKAVNVIVPGDTPRPPLKVQPGFKYYGMLGENKGMVRRNNYWVQPPKHQGPDGAVDNENPFSGTPETHCHERGLKASYVIAELKKLARLSPLICSGGDPKRAVNFHDAMKGRGGILDQTSTGRIAHSFWAMAPADMVGPPEYFISHTWTHPLPHFIDMMERFFKDKMADKKVWFDVFCINQHIANRKVEGGGWEAVMAPLDSAVVDAMTNTVAFTERTIFFMDPLCLALNRIWCVYEIWQTVGSENSKLTLGDLGEAFMVGLKGGRQDTVRSLVFDVKDYSDLEILTGRGSELGLYTAVQQLDCARAEATNYQDQVTIQACISADGGAGPVTQQLKLALMKSAEAEIKRCRKDAACPPELLASALMKDVVLKFACAQDDNVVLKQINEAVAITERMAKLEPHSLQVQTDALQAKGLQSTIMYSSELRAHKKVTEKACMLLRESLELEQGIAGKQGRHAHYLAIALMNLGIALSLAPEEERAKCQKCPDESLQLLQLSDEVFVHDYEINEEFTEEKRDVNRALVLSKIGHALLAQHLAKDPSGELLTMDSPATTKLYEALRLGEAAAMPRPSKDDKKRAWAAMSHKPKASSSLASVYSSVANVHQWMFNAWHKRTKARCGGDKKALRQACLIEGVDLFRPIVQFRKQALEMTLSMVGRFNDGDHFAHLKRQMIDADITFKLLQGQSELGLLFESLCCWCCTP